jgi:hypothetical protein
MDLNLRDAGNEAEMIVIVAAPVASLSPTADIAMLDWIGVGVICRRRSHGHQKGALHLPEIRGIVGEAILLRLKFGPWRVFWRKALHGGQQVGIET